MTDITQQTGAPRLGVTDVVLLGITARRAVAVPSSMNLQVAFNVSLVEESGQANCHFRARCTVTAKPVNEPGGEESGEDQSPIFLEADYALVLGESPWAKDLKEASQAAAVASIAWPYVRSSLGLLTSLLGLPKIPLPLSPAKLADDQISS